MQTEATLDFVTSLSECDQLSLFGRKRVRMCTARTLFLVQGDHDQYGWSEMQIPKAAGKADIWHSEQKQAIAYGFSAFILFCHEGSI